MVGSGWNFFLHIRLPRRLINDVVGPVLLLQLWWGKIMIAWNSGFTHTHAHTHTCLTIHGIVIIIPITRGKTHRERGGIICERNRCQIGTDDNSLPSKDCFIKPYFTHVLSDCHGYLLHLSHADTDTQSLNSLYSQWEKSTWCFPPAAATFLSDFIWSDKKYKDIVYS